MKLLCLTVIFLCAASSAFAQDAGDLRKQLEQLKQEYQQKIQDLEQRLTALEERNKAAVAAEKSATEKSAPPPATPQAVTAAVGAAANTAVKNAIASQLRTYQGQLPSEPMYDLLRDAETKIGDLEGEAKSFEFHGYLRSGYGLDSEGGQTVAFQAPGAGAKFRLGNEAETYGEFIFDNNWVNPEHATDKMWIKTEAMIEADTTNSSNHASDDKFRLREAFIQIGNIFESQQEAKFWAGERYYRRQHIEIDDFYTLDMSGYGAGVEDVNLKFGKASLAFLAGANQGIVTGSGNYSKSNIDLRIYDVNGPGGKLGFWFNYAMAKGGTTSSGERIPNADGYAFRVSHNRLKWEGGFNTASIQYGKGAASNFSTALDDPTPYLRTSERLLITDQLLFQQSDNFAIMPIAVYQRFKDGNPQHGHDQWLSFGARPEVFFTEHVSLAFEGGFDRVWSGRNLYGGWLRKFTIAPQLGAGRKFMSRPVLRLFLTYGNWSDGLRGFVGGVPYQFRTSGFTYGVQGETWW